ncbi:MAG: DUF4145 domain-containing protein [Nitrospirota bacterium]|nr:DUF4145 domain-containing protein [Nitrospirota bacterium]
MNSLDSVAILGRVKRLSDELKQANPPPEETTQSYGQLVIYMSLVTGTRGYIEKIVHQINGSYESGWYDACAVMIRRLIETLIIEAFETHKISSQIKNSSDDFLYLKDLINATLAEKSWNLGRNAKKSLQSIKDIGDRSAHSRRFVAHRRDIDKVMDDLRIVVQELIYLANLK